VTPLGGYDNAWLFDGWKAGVVKPVVTVQSQLTGIKLAMTTDQPSVQMYTGNFLNGTNTTTRIQRKKSQSFGSKPQYYHYRGAFTLEAQQYIDAVNNPNFPSITLKKGERYSQIATYTFTVDA
jgi:aldose 1-epimerase